MTNLDHRHEQLFADCEVNMASQRLCSSRRKATRRRASKTLVKLLLLVYFWSESRSDRRTSASFPGNLNPNLCQSVVVFATAAETDELTNDYLVRKADTSSSLTNVRDEKALSFDEILIKAGKRGIGGGISGALAGVVQVLTLMWVRTVISYQSRYGYSFFQALNHLLQEGGIGRLYRGLLFALLQGPLARFGSIAANDGIAFLLLNLKWTREWGPTRTTIIASFVVGLWRIFLMRESDWVLA